MKSIAERNTKTLAREVRKGRMTQAEANRAHVNVARFIARQQADKAGRR